MAREAPIFSENMPGWMFPTPTAAATWSMQPEQICTSGESPSCTAASGRIRPTTCPGSMISGSHAGSMPANSSTSAQYVFVRMSQYSVELSREHSETNRPVR